MLGFLKQSEYPSRAAACPEKGDSMDFRVLMSVFTAIFVAELGDKTQLATMLFSTNKDVSRLTVFIGASLALILTTAIGVLAGKFLCDHINTKYLSWGAGALFIIMGGYTIATAS